MQSTTVKNDSFMLLFKGYYWKVTVNLNILLSVITRYLFNRTVKPFDRNFITRSGITVQGLLVQGPKLWNASDCHSRSRAFQR